MVSDSRMNVSLSDENHYALNPECSVCVSYIGKEQSPVVIIDNLWMHPSKLVDLAADETQGRFSPSSDDFYPGVRKPLNTDLVVRFQFEIAVLLRQHMSRPVNRIETHFSAFSLTTTPEDKLAPIQCIPHFDTVAKHEFAMVCYLFKQPLGGTSFYRHRKTGFEVISEERQYQYMRVLQTQATTEGLPAATFIQGTTDMFERIHSVPAWFNRGVLYPANLLHSGDLQDAKHEGALVNDASTGRLTFNAGIKLLP